MHASSWLPACRSWWRSVCRRQTLRIALLSKHVCVQVWRGLLDMFRNPSMIIITWLLAIVFGVFCGGVFWDLDLSIDGIQNRAGVIFFSLVFLGFLSVTSIDSLMAERAVVHKEQKLGYV